MELQQDTHKLTIVSYNLHGLNQGRPYLETLCDKYDIVLTQEHWLAQFNLDRLNYININMTCYASSAMDDVISKGCLRGRPFGGVAVFVKNCIAANATLIKSAPRYIILQLGQTLLVNVYLPCSSTVCRDEEFDDCLACIMNEITNVSYSTVLSLVVL